MKKRLFALLTVFALMLLPLTAKAEIYTTLGVGYAYDTNVFSNPLPLYDDSYDYRWLKWRRKNPFIEKHSFGMDISSEIFFSDAGRTGLSTALSFRIPIASTSITPTPENENSGFYGNWEYIYSNSLEAQKTSLFWSLGPSFRAEFGFIDLGLSLRLSIGEYDVTSGNVILGFQAEPFLNVYFHDRMYVSFRFTYDQHVMKFLAEGPEIFDDGYQMITLSPVLGMGIRF